MPSPEQFDKALPDLKYREFVIELLDERHSIEDLLRLKRSHLYASYRGFRAEGYRPPYYLSSMLGPIHQSSNSDTMLDFSVTEVNQTDLDVTSVTISSENRPPIFINKEQGFDGLGIVTAEQANEVLILGDDALEETLRSFLPEQARESASLKQATNALGLYSVEKDISTSFYSQGQDFVGEVRFSDVETFDDSIQVLEVVNRHPYIDGATIGTRLRITESILQRMANQGQKSVNHILDILTNFPVHEPIITIEDLLDDDGYSIEVKHPTQRHIDDIKATLQLLK